MDFKFNSMFFGHFLAKRFGKGIIILKKPYPDPYPVPVLDWICQD